MLMDLFFEGADVSSKRRIHFHEFMIEVHDTIHAWRQSPDKQRKRSRSTAANRTGNRRKSALLC